MRFYNMLTNSDVQSQAWQDSMGIGDFYTIDGFIYGEIIGQTDRRGFFCVKAHSPLCIEGETGVCCIVEMTRKVTEIEFREALRVIGNI